MINKKISPYFISLTLIIFFRLSTFAQQVPHYTQYLYNMQVLNPAYVGVKSDLSVSLLARQQWVGVEGAPETNTFSVNGRTRDGLGIGATVINDKIGLTQSTNINIDASYTIQTSQFGRLAVGLKGGISYFSNNLSEGSTPDNDVYESTPGRFPNIGFGGLYYTDRFMIGLSIPNILKSNQFEIFETTYRNNSISNANYFLTGEAIFDISEDLKYKPSAIIKYTPTLPVSFDVNSNFMYKETIEAGLSYRYKQSISALLAVIINKKVRIGYAYDYQLAEFGDNLISHEIILTLNLNLNRQTRWLYYDRCCF